MKRKVSDLISQDVWSVGRPCSLNGGLYLLYARLDLLACHPGTFFLLTALLLGSPRPALPLRCFLRHLVDCSLSLPLCLCSPSAWQRDDTIATHHTHSHRNTVEGLDQVPGARHKVEAEESLDCIP